MHIIEAFRIGRNVTPRQAAVSFKSTSCHLFLPFLVGSRLGLVLSTWLLWQPGALFPAKGWPFGTWLRWRKCTRRPSGRSSKADLGSILGRFWLDSSPLRSCQLRRGKNTGFGQRRAAEYHYNCERAPVHLGAAQLKGRPAGCLLHARAPLSRSASGGRPFALQWKLVEGKGGRSG